MKRALRILAVMVLLGAAGWWAAAGANRSWTKNKEAIKTPDPVTGLERVEWKNTFVPGFDFMAAAVVAAGFFAGASFIFRNKKTL